MGHGASARPYGTRNTWLGCCPRITLRSILPPQGRRPVRGDPGAGLFSCLPSGKTAAGDQRTGWAGEGGREMGMEKETREQMRQRLEEALPGFRLGRAAAGERPSWLRALRQAAGITAPEFA